MRYDGVKAKEVGGSEAIENVKVCPGRKEAGEGKAWV